MNTYIDCKREDGLSQNIKVRLLNMFRIIKRFINTFFSTSNNIINDNSKVAENKTKLQHIAIIMDGNGRYAEKKGLERSLGHIKGASQVEKIVDACLERKIPYLTLYAFSSENWKRPQAEIDQLMHLFAEYSQKLEAKMCKEGVLMSYIGDIDNLPSATKEVLRATQKNTHRYVQEPKLHLTIAINYGSRQEIVKACREIAVLHSLGQISEENINEKYFQTKLYTASLPDPDLLIRTSGEFRLSNFLLWQIAYSEIYISPVNWPDFTIDELDKAIQNYYQRERRYGAVKAKSKKELGEKNEK